MKHYFYLFILSLLFVSCIQKNEDNALGGYIDDEEYFEEFYVDTLIPSGTADTYFETDTLAKDTSFIDFSNTVLDALDESKFIDFSNYFHPQKGCTFVPYTLIEEVEQNFNPNTFESALTEKSTLFWGFEDGSGDSLNLTIDSYFKRYVYDINFKAKSTEIHINKNLQFSNTQNNIKHFYPDAQFIEFYYEGSNKYEGMDWSSLIFYIEKFEEKHYLVAIAHNQWTI